MRTVKNFKIQKEIRMFCLNPITSRAIMGKFMNDSIRGQLLSIQGRLLFTYKCDINLPNNPSFSIVIVNMQRFVSLR